jgi:hypothetical protein
MEVLIEVGGRGMVPVKKRVLFSRAETEEPAPKTIKHTKEATDGKLWCAEMIVIGNHFVVPIYIPQTCTRYPRCDDSIATPNSEPVSEDVVTMSVHRRSDKGRWCPFGYARSIGTAESMRSGFTHLLVTSPHIMVLPSSA